MKSFIILFLFGFCSSELRSKEDIECNCRLGLKNGKILDSIQVLRQSLQVSNNCDRKDFDVCADGCTETITKDTNGFDLNKPKVNETEKNLSLGQHYCNQIKADVSDGKILMAVTLDCSLEKETTVDRNGTILSLGTTAVQSSITRLFDSGFKQKLRCVDNKYIKE